MISAILLGLLAIIDAGFCGFRDAAGRDRRIAKAPYYRGAIRRGMVFGVAVVAIFGAVVGGMLASAPDAAAAWVDLSGAAGRMVVVYGLYATAVLGALGVYMLGSSDVRTLGTVAVLGPFTLVRPMVICAGAAWAMLGATEPSSRVLAGIAAVVMVLFQPALERARRAAA